MFYLCLKVIYWVDLEVTCYFQLSNSEDLCCYAEDPKLKSRVNEKDGCHP